jgi:hypothetical protein
MKCLLLALPFVLAACSGEKTATFTAPNQVAASRSGDDGGWSHEKDDQSSSTVVVSPANMHGWAFFNDQTDTPCSDPSCQMVFGPAKPPLGVGSAELWALTPVEGKILALYQRYKGVPFRKIDRLSYWTYRQASGTVFPTSSPNPLAISLQFNVDYDVTDANNSYQGRIVFEPYYTATVETEVWQRWKPLAGKWWSSRPANAVRNNVPTPSPCTQASPCTWSQLLTLYPNAGFNTVFGGVILKAGSGWTDFKGNTDALTIGLRGSSKTYDFEPVVARTRKDCRNNGWTTARRADGTPFTSEADCLAYVRGRQDDDDGGDHHEHGGH